MSGHHHRDEDPVATLVASALLVGCVLLCAGLVGAYNAATCARWGTRTEQRTDCYEVVKGYHTCETRPVEVSYCAERKP